MDGHVGLYTPNGRLFAQLDLTERYVDAQGLAMVDQDVLVVTSSHKQRPVHRIYLIHVEYATSLTIQWQMDMSGWVSMLSRVFQHTYVVVNANSTVCINAVE
jgi:hypothetical protein